MGPGTRTQRSRTDTQNPKHGASQVSLVVHEKHVLDHISAIGEPLEHRKLLRGISLVERGIRLAAE